MPLVKVTASPAAVLAAATVALLVRVTGPPTADGNEGKGAAGGPVPTPSPRVADPSTGLLRLLLMTVTSPSPSPSSPLSRARVRLLSTPPPPLEDPEAAGEGVLVGGAVARGLVGGAAVAAPGRGGRGLRRVGVRVGCLAMCTGACLARCTPMRASKHCLLRRPPVRLAQPCNKFSG